MGHSRIDWVVSTSPGRAAEFELGWGPSLRTAESRIIIEHHWIGLVLDWIGVDIYQGPWTCLWLPSQ